MNKIVPLSLKILGRL